MNKSTKDILIALIALVALVFVWGGWQAFQVKQNSNTNKDNVFCTADAKMCPDGTYVGRIAPDCEFAVCPRN